MIVKICKKLCNQDHTCSGVVCKSSTAYCCYECFRTKQAHKRCFSGDEHMLNQYFNYLVLRNKKAEGKK